MHNFMVQMALLELDDILKLKKKINSKFTIMYITLFFTLLFARRLSIHTILIGDTCYVGSESRIKHLEN